MIVTVNFTSHERMIEALLFLPEKAVEHQTTALLFEGSVTGVTNQITEYIADQVSSQGFVCLVMDHAFYGSTETVINAIMPPERRIEDLIAAMNFLKIHKAVDPEKIIGVGVSLGAHFMVEACRKTTLCKGLVIVRGPLDETPENLESLPVPHILIDESSLDSAADEITLWSRTLFNQRPAERDAEM